MISPDKQPSFDHSSHVILSKKDYQDLIDQTRKLQDENRYLQHELDKLKRMIFGAKSERFIPSDSSQLSLDLGQGDQPTVEPKSEEITYTRQKTDERKGHARTELPAQLPREVVVIEPVEDVSEGKKIGEVITEVLDYKPGNLIVTRYVRPKYALPNDQGIVIGQLPSLPISPWECGKRFAGPVGDQQICRSFTLLSPGTDVQAPGSDPGRENDQRLVQRRL
jgi:hypothetical protein